MQRQTTVPQGHPAEPVPSSFRAVTGEDADLFNLDHYPVHATCRICSEPIHADSFLRAFRHDEQPGPLTSLPRGECGGLPARYTG
jgi:hypothetical protein